MPGTRIAPAANDMVSGYMAAGSSAFDVGVIPREAFQSTASAVVPGKFGARAIWTHPHMASP